MRTAKSLLWIDGSGGLIVGALVLAVAPWLSALYAVPVGLIHVMGGANLAYGGYSLSLARRAVRPRALLLFLVAANLAWAVICAVATAWLAQEASAFGLAHLMLEGVYVGCLGLLEWKYLDVLRTAA